MIISAHQPEYLPYLGFFYKMAKADKFILVDKIQFSTGGFQNRNRIRTASDHRGWAWLTVPVISSGRGYQEINEVKIDNSIPWGRQHWKAVYFNYKKTPFFDMYEEFFKKLYSKKWQKLADLNETIIYYIKDELGIKTPIAKSLEPEVKGDKIDRIINLCKEFKADSYLSGPGAKNPGEKSYVEEEKFENKNFKLIFSDFNHPVYPQRFEPFLQNMSVIDLLFNCGPKSLEIIQSSSRT